MTTAFSCGRTFNFPFVSFPIFIFDDDQTGTKLWLEIFKEARVITSINELFVALAQDLRERGGLVIRGATYSPLCRDSFLNVISATVDVAISKQIKGFYIDDLNANVLRTPIADISPRQVLQESDRFDLGTLFGRSFWIHSLVDYSRLILPLEGQLYPALVTRPFTELNQPPRYGLVLILILLLLLAIVYCLITLYL